MTEKRRYCAPKHHDTWETGRDSSGRCLACKKHAGRAVRYARIAEEQGIREAERLRQEEEEQAVLDEAFRHRQEELERRREEKYEALIRQGGDVATEARWFRANEETLDEYDGRYELCRWSLEPSGRSGGCFRRTTSASFCYRHEREYQRQRARKAKAAKR